MKRIGWLAVIGGLWAVVLVWPARAAAGPALKLDPASGSHNVGSSWVVEVGIDTVGEQVGGADAKLGFDPGFLEVASVEAGSFFGGQNFVQVTNNNSGTLYLGDVFENQFETRSGQGVLATVTLRGKQAGEAALDFDCTTGKTNDSNILDGLANDVIDCAAVVSGSYTLVAQGGTGTPTPTPTGTGSVTGTPTLTPTPTSAGEGGNGATATPVPGTPTPTPEIPVTGAWEVTAVGVGGGILLLLLGLMTGILNG